MQIQRAASCQVNRARALRYLGYQDQALSVEMHASIDQAVAECESISRPAWCYQVFPAQFRNGAVMLEGAALEIPCEGASASLAKASACAIMVCTIGLGFEQKALQLAVTDPVGSLIFDSVGSSLAESCADDCERAIHALAVQSELHAGQRMSPGYGAIPLSLSRGIVRALDAGKRFGVAVTESDMLVPTKSVTAIVGLFEKEDDARHARYSCVDCVAYADCPYRKSGAPCYL